MTTAISRRQVGDGRFGRGWPRSSSQVGGFTVALRLDELLNLIREIE